MASFWHSLRRQITTNPDWVLESRPKLGYASPNDRGVELNLDEYLTVERITSATFAGWVGASVHAVKKWRRKARIPRPDRIAEIETLTQGRVAPNDWYKRKNQRSRRGRV